MKCQQRLPATVWDHVQHQRGSITVHVTSVQGLSKIYAVLSENIDVCLELEAALAEYSSGRIELQPSTIIEPPFIYLAYNSKGQAYRAFIECIFPDVGQVEVQNLDSGERERKSMNELFVLPEALFAHPGQAFQLAPRGVPSTYCCEERHRLTAFLEQLTVGKVLVANNNQVDVGRKCLLVDLWGVSEGKRFHFNSMVRDVGYAAVTEPFLPPSPGEKFLVNLLHFDPEDLCLYLQQTEYKGIYDTMLMALNDRCIRSQGTHDGSSLILLDSELLVSTRCCVWYEAIKQWCRAAIKSVSSDRKLCTVYLLDFCRTMDVESSKLLRAPTLDSIYLKGACRQYFLADFVPCREEEKLKAVANYIHALSLGGQLYLTTGNFPMVQVSIVEDGKETDLSQRLMEIQDGHFAFPTSAPVTKTAMVRDPSLPPTRPVQHALPEFNIPAKGQRKYYEAVRVLYTTAPDCFALAFQPANRLNQYVQLLFILEAEQQALKKSLQCPYLWSQGDMCAVPHDGAFERGYILSLAGGMADIYRVDFGRACQVPVDSLRELPEKAWQCPFQAVIARLYGVNPVNGKSWSENACNLFTKYCRDDNVEGRLCTGDTSQYKNTSTAFLRLGSLWYTPTLVMRLKIGTAGRGNSNRPGAVFGENLVHMKLVRKCEAVCAATSDKLCEL